MCKKSVYALAFKAGAYFTKTEGGMLKENYMPDSYRLHTASLYGLYERVRGISKAASLFFRLAAILFPLCFFHILQTTY